MIEKRYENNIGSVITEELQEKFKTLKVGVIGCGGQGGYVAEFLTRLGIGTIILFDGDVFDESNLNRQIGATETTIGLNKAIVTKNKCNEINSNTIIIAKDTYFGENPKEDYEVLKNCNFIFDEMDYNHYNKSARNILNKLLNYCPITNGGNGLFGSEISILTKNNLNEFNNTTTMILSNTSNAHIEQPACLCAATAAIEVLQMIRYFKELPQNINVKYYYDYYNNRVTHSWKGF